MKIIISKDSNMIEIPMESNLATVRYTEGFGWQYDEMVRDEIEAWAAEMAKDNERFKYEIV